MSEKIITVSISIDNKKVTLEGPEDFVKAEVQRLTSGLSNKIGTNDSRPITSAPAALAPAEKDVIRNKQPKGHPETVAVLAFCLTENGQEEFSEEDMRRAYIRAGVKPPKVVSQAIRDARNVHDYIEAGSERGKYKLSHHGDRTVRFDLPRVDTK